MIGCVPDQVGFSHTDVGNAAAVVAPCRTVIGARVLRYLARTPCLCIALGRNYPDVAVFVAVRLFGAVAGECNRFAVRTPDRLRIVVVAESELQRFCLTLTDDIKMIAAAIEIRHAVLLELQPVDDVWQWFRLFAGLVCCLFCELGCRFVLDYQ